MDIAIGLENVSKTFGDRQAVRSMRLQVKAGERVALLGASGSGKSTLIRLISGLERADAGSGAVSIHGRWLQIGGSLPADSRSIRREIGVIFQQFNLVGRLPVLTNVLTGLSGQVPLWRSLLGRYTPQQRARALDALTQLGLRDHAFQRASTLSGGQQQRAAIARTLVQGARIVLADEPVASLDPQSTKRVMDELKRLNEDQSVTVVVSLHQVELARRYCHRIVALSHGELVFDGRAEELDSALIERLYGQDARELLEPVPDPIDAPTVFSPA